MSLLGLSPKLCLRALPARPAVRLCRAAACRTFTSSPSLLDTSAKPPKGPGFLYRIKWYKEDDSRAGRAPMKPLTMYEELPPTYRDRDGLPFAKRDLTPAEVAKIFGNRIKPEFANTLLKIMHGRRVAGTLDDPAYNANTARFTSEQKEAALRYLRETIPVDETMNKGLRAQDELEQLEKEIAGMREGEESAKHGAASAQVEGATAKDQEAPLEEPETEVTPRGNPAYGVGALDHIRARNVARIKAEEKRIEEEQKAKGEPVAGTLEAYIDRGAMSPRMAEWHEKGSSGLEKPPELSEFDRLFPSVTLAGLLIAACVAFATLYNPPEDQDRVFFDITPEMATIGTMIGINLAVYALWKVPPLWRFMNNYFVVVVGMPRAISVLTAQFSHQSLQHVLLNMAVLYYIGSRLHEEVGRANFLTIYLSSGALGYVASLACHGLEVATLGASGSVLGITAAYFFLHLWDKFRILGFPAPPAEGVDGFPFIVALIAWNLIPLLAPSRLAAAATSATTGSADVVSHLGGLLSGMGVVYFLRDVVETIDGEKGKSDSGEKGDGNAAGVSEGEQARGDGERPRKTLDLWGATHGSYVGGA
ncbi:hypothetical protein VUR80DRAFT_936 [Thermomyces stellatus]